MNNLTPNIISKLKGLGIYQIAGGAVGVILILWAALIIQEWSQQSIVLVLLLYSFMLLFFAFSIYCGILCLKKHSIALKLSLINQILQVIGFAMFGVSFQYVAGIYFTVGLDLTQSFNLNFGLGIPTFKFYINDGSHQLLVTFNFVALGLIIFIEKLRKQIKEKQEQLIV